jgi:hypothetical protein
MIKTTIKRPQVFTELEGVFSPSQGLLMSDITALAILGAFRCASNCRLSLFPPFSPQAAMLPSINRYLNLLTENYANWLLK